MLLSATLSKPSKNVALFLGNDFIRIKIKLSSSAADVYQAELYTKTQVFHKKMSAAEALKFIEENVPRCFKNCVERTESQEITLLANKKNEVSEIVKNLQTASAVVAPAKAVPEQSGGISRARRRSAEDAALQSGTVCSGRPDKNYKNLFTQNSFNRKKNYILCEGSNIPFLVRLGIMTAEGKVISAKYDKFRQINRFLEILRDTLDDILPLKHGEALSIVDFGSGKSYLTFAVQYYLTEILGLDCQIFGLDLKKDVIEYCSKIAEELKLKNLTFAVGDIAQFGEDKKPDIIITLHACDTATDYALNYAVKKGALAILSVPCCQHELNLQLKKSSVEENSAFEPLLKYGLIKERFSALVTDCVRGELLEGEGYKVQMLEFIDDAGTPKNLMIRAVKKENRCDQTNQAQKTHKSRNALLKELNVSQTLENLLHGE